MPKGYPGTRTITHGALSAYRTGCRCVPCVTVRRAYKNTRYRKYSILARKYELQKKYGITLEDYENLFTHQKGLCAICGTPPKLFRLSIDHCHSRLNIRGLLCVRCNGDLGWYEKYKIQIEGYLARNNAKNSK